MKVGVSLVIVALFGCGTTGWIRFESVDPTFAAQARAPTTLVETVDCEDYKSGEQPRIYPYARRKILYITACTKDGGPVPWKVLGVFHSGSVAFDKWDKYSREVAEKARERGCPGVLLRRSPPTMWQEAQGVGALCVDPAQPSHLHGPLRLAAQSEQPLHVLDDGEPDPRAP